MNRNKIQHRKPFQESNRPAKTVFNRYFIEPTKTIGRGIGKYAAMGVLSLAIANGGCATTLSIAINRDKTTKKVPPADVACGVLIDVGGIGGGISGGILTNKFLDEDRSNRDAVIAGVTVLSAIVGGALLGSIPCLVAWGSESDGYSPYDPAPGAAQKQFIQKQQPANWK